MICPMSLIAMPVEFWIPAIRALMSSVASAVCRASSLISLATTANPLPAVPARAASMVAFSASRLVCAEMLVMVSVTWPISCAAWPSFCIWSVMVCAWPVACSLMARASRGIGGDVAHGGAHLLGGAGHGGEAARGLLHAGGDRHGVGAGLFGRRRDGMSFL